MENIQILRILCIEERKRNIIIDIEVINVADFQCDERDERVENFFLTKSTGGSLGPPV